MGGWRGDEGGKEWENNSVSEDMEKQKFLHIVGIFTFENYLELFSKIDNNLAFSSRNQENLRDSYKHTQKTCSGCS